MGNDSKYGSWSWFQTKELGDEPVYCEATHNHDDVIYSGSDDEYYESATARRLRYEAQAIRYLNGDQPYLLSATLKGPFTKESGWTNPWQSKRVKPPKPSATPRKSTRNDEVIIPGTTSHILEVGDEEPKGERKHAEDLRRSRFASRLENAELSSTQATNLYPLPSPGSTHAPSVISNPYMDSSALNRVQMWRDDVKTTAASKEPFWAPNSGNKDQTGSKKRASDSEWLKKKVAKRAKLDNEGPFVPNSPIDAIMGKRAVHPPLSAKTTLGSSTNGARTAETISSFQHIEPSHDAGNAEGCSINSLAPQIELQDAPDDTSMSDASTGANEESLPSRCTPRRHAQRVSPTTSSLQKPSNQASGRPSLAHSLHGVSVARASSTSRNLSVKREDSPEVARMWKKWSSQRNASSTRMRSPTPQKSQQSGSDGEDEEEVEPDAESLASSAGGMVHGTELETQQDHSFLYRTKAKQDNGGEAPKELDQSVTVRKTASIPSLSSLSSSASEVTSNSDEHCLPLEPAPLRTRVESDEPVTDNLLSPDQKKIEIQMELDTSSDRRKPQSDIEAENAKLQAEAAIVDYLKPAKHSPIDQFQLSLPDTSSVTSQEISSLVEQSANVEQAFGLLSDMHDQGAEDPVENEPNARDRVGEKSELQNSANMPSQQDPQSPWTKQSEEIVYRVQHTDPRNDDGQPEPLARSSLNLLDPSSRHHLVDRAPETNTIGAASVLSKIQRPFKEGVASTPQLPPAEHISPSQSASFLSLDLIASQALSAVSNLLPWSESEAGVLPAPSGMSGPISSPDRQLLSESFERSESWDMVEDIQPQTGPALDRPTTPPAESSIAEPASSIKPFSNFLTPSPAKQWKPKRTSPARGSRLPSTQILVDAAISNPWTSTSSAKSNRRVSFAPLPGESNEDSDDDANKENEVAECDLPKGSGKSARAKAAIGARAVSPPLPTHSDDLQDHDQRFAAHFQAMAQKNRLPRLRRSLLPSASQQILASPAVEAMAEAFIEAEQTKIDPADDIATNSSPNDQEQIVEQQPAAIQQNDESVDDVSAVIDNLGDFLDAWDVDAELLRARSETVPVPAAGASQMTGLEINVWST